MPAGVFHQRLLVLILRRRLEVMERLDVAGTLVAFQAYVMTMWMPVRWIGMINQMAQQVMQASASRSHTPFEVGEPDAVPLPGAGGRLRHVSFAYGSRLLATSISARAGPTIATSDRSAPGRYDHQPDPALLRRDPRRVLIDIEATSRPVAVGAWSASSCRRPSSSTYIRRTSAGRSRLTKTSRGVAPRRRPRLHLDPGLLRHHGRAHPPLGRAAPADRDRARDTGQPGHPDPRRRPRAPTPGPTT